MPGTAVRRQDIEVWEAETGITISPGDALFLRTGRDVGQQGGYQAVLTPTSVDTQATDAGCRPGSCGSSPRAHQSSGASALKLKARCSWNKVAPAPRTSGSTSASTVRTMAPSGKATGGRVRGDACSSAVSVFGPAPDAQAAVRPSPAPAALTPSNRIASRRLTCAARASRMVMSSLLVCRGVGHGWVAEAHACRSPRSHACRQPSRNPWVHARW